MATPPVRTALADTYPNPSNAVFRTGIGAFFDYVIGLLGTTGNAAEARSALGIGSAISYRNRAMNGNFAVNQRVVSGTVTLAPGAYGHDRWKAGAAGCTYTFAPSGIDTIITITAGSLVEIIEGIEIEGGVYCMSWFGTAKGKIGAGAYSDSGVNSASLATGENVAIEFNTGTLSRVQVEPGTTPSPFERVPFEEMLHRCERFYQKSYTYSVAPLSVELNGNTAYAIGLDASTALIITPLHREMRVAAGVSTYNPATGAGAQVRSMATGAAIAIGGPASSGTKGIGLTYSSAGAFTVGAVYGFNWTAAADL